MKVVEGSASYGGCDSDATAAQYDSLHKEPERLQEDRAIAGLLKEFLGRFGRCGYKNERIKLQTIAFFRRKFRMFRSETSDNMDSWKSRGGKSQRGEEKK